MKDYLQNLEDGANRSYDESIQPNGKFKCEYSRIFDPDEEGGTLSANPYAMPVCGPCFIGYFNLLKES